MRKRRPVARGTITTWKTSLSVSTTMKMPATMLRMLTSMLSRCRFVTAGRQAARSRMACAMAVVFVTGPVSSGKSAFAVRLALESGREVTYIATAAGEPEDVEWRARLTRHVRDRPASWRTVETASMPLAAQLALFSEAPQRRACLVDALGTWLATRIAARIDLLEIDYNVLASKLDDEAGEVRRRDAELARLGGRGQRTDRVGRRAGCGLGPALSRCDGADGSAAGEVGR